MSELTPNVWESYIACHCRDSQDKNIKTKIRPFVTISRQTGAGGITIGEKLVGYLNGHDKNESRWILFDRNLIQEVLKSHHLPGEFAKFMPEDKISEIQDMMEEIFGLHPSQWALVHKTTETILHCAQAGNVILIGRGANVITRKFLSSGFHVRLIGSLERRIKHIQDYYQLAHDEAVEFIRQEDRGRRNYLKQNFDKDVNDPLLYDIVINTDYVSYDDAAQMIAEEVLRKFNA